jgi:HTH-type transcriptional regulator, sugar sensing transcriptional regulator
LEEIMGSEEDIIATLKEFGIERDETLFYIALLQLGSSTVNMLGAKLDMERAKAYRILHKLQNLGLVSTTFSNPTLCTVVEPEKALDLLIHKKEEETINLKKLATKIARDLDRFKNTDYETSQLPSFYIIQGRPNIYSRMAKIIEESEKIIYIATTIEDATRMYYTAIPEKIKESVISGAQVNLLVNTCDAESLHKINGLNATAVRIGKLPAETRMVILPESRLMISGRMNRSMSLNDDVDSVMYTNSLEFVKNMEILFLNLWGDAKSW